MQKQQVIKQGNCNHCGKFVMLYGIEGLADAPGLVFICVGCIDSLGKLGKFPQCKNCRCLLNTYHLYPTDAVKGSQDYYCQLCFDMLGVEIEIINSTPRKERPALIKAIDKMKGKEK